MNYKGPCDLNQSSHTSVSSGLRITLETIVFDGGLLNYGAKFIVRGGAYETMEGNARERNVVVEYKDHTTALPCYRSPEYQAAKSLRQRYADSDFIVIEGAEAT